MVNPYIYFTVTPFPSLFWWIFQPRGGFARPAKDHHQTKDRQDGDIFPEAHGGGVDGVIFNE